MCMPSLYGMWRLQTHGEPACLLPVAHLSFCLQADITARSCLYMHCNQKHY